MDDVVLDLVAVHQQLPSSSSTTASKKRRRISEGTDRLSVESSPKLRSPQTQQFMETFSQLQAFQRKGLLCDLILIPQDDQEHRLPVHSCILAASSLYLKAMLTGHLGSKLRTTSPIKEVHLAFDYSTLAALVDFAYGSGLDVCGDSVTALLAAADFLRMEEAVTVCCDWLLKNLSVDSSFMVRDISLEYRQIILLENVDRFMQEHFEAVSNRPEFCSLHSRDLDRFLSSNDLVVHSEMDVHRALVKWAAHDPIGRKDDFARMFTSHIRLEFFRPVELQDIVSSDSMASKSQQVSQLCEETLRDLAMYLRLQPSGFENGTRARRWKVDKSIYLLGGRNEEQVHLKGVKHFLAHKATWAPREEMKTARAFLGVATLDNVVFAVGGYNEQQSFLDSVEYYSPVARTWQFARHLNVARASLGLCAFGDRLIAVGGENRALPNVPDQSPVYLSSVEVYNSRSNSWRMGTSMSTPRSFIGLGLEGAAVYAIGGYDGEDYLRTVERYDPARDVWSTVAPLNAPRSCCGVATLNGCLYVAGGYNTDHCLRSVEMYDPRSNTWTNMPPLEVERSYLSMVEFNGSLYAIGGLDSNESALDIVERYDPVLQRWFSCAPLASPVYASGLCVLDEKN